MNHAPFSLQFRIDVLRGKPCFCLFSNNGIVFFSNTTVVVLSANMSDPGGVSLQIHRELCCIWRKHPLIKHW